MGWEECMEFIRKVSFDSERCKSIIETAEERVRFINSLKADEKNASFIFENYYEVIKELLVAFMLKEGLRSKNHQCLFTFFLKKCPDYEAEANTISQMSYLRNRLDYYGEKVEYSYFIENYKSFENIIKLLVKLLK